MDTGDMGYLLMAIVITGPRQDLILHNGRNSGPGYRVDPEEDRARGAANVRRLAVDDADGPPASWYSSSGRLTEPER